jgi:hypothetical protein
MTPLWILSGVAFALAAILLGISVSHHKFHALWATYVGIVLAFAAIFVWWHATIAERDLQSEPAPNLDKQPSPALSPAKGETEPQNAPPPSPSLTLLEIEKRLEEANKHGKKAQVLKALDGAKVDCVMHFFTAVRRDNNVIHVGFKEDREGPISILSVVLPLEGNEHWLTTGTLDVFRIRGEVDANTCDSIQIGLRNATVEYVRTDQASLPKVRPRITSLRDLESLTYEEILERLWEAGSDGKRERIAQAVVGMRVDWTLTLQSVSKASDNRFFVFLTAGRDAEGEDRPEDKYHAGLVAFFIPREGHERFPLLEEYKQRIRVRGKVKSAQQGNFTLEDTEFELV